MADAKTKKTDASVSDFINAIGHERKREETKTLLKIFKQVTRKQPKMWGESMVGFGDLHYVYDTGHEGDIFCVGFSPRKQKHSLYLMCDIERLKPELKKLGKYSNGKGCLYINKLDDVDLEVLKTMIKKSFEAAKKLDKKK